MLDYLPLRNRTRVLLAPQTTASAAQTYAAPTPGVNAITVRCIAKMGNAADLVLSLKYSDDAAGTNAAAWGSDVILYKDGVRQTDAKALTVGDASGNFIVDFCVDPATVPAGKFVGVHYGNSHADNLLTTMIIEDVVYRPTATA
jgi:hypothetical protein